MQPRLATGGFGRFLFKTADIPSAGASGALFGLVGVLFIFGIKFRRELPEGFRRAFGTGMLPIIIINLFIGYIGRGFIDNAAHLGGLLSGAALATVVQYRRVGERRGLAAVWRVLQVVALLLVVIAFYKTARNFNRSLQLANLPALNQQAQMSLSYIGTMNALRQKTADVIQKRDLSNVSGLTQLAVQAPAPDARAAELRERLVSILSRLTSAVASASPPQGDGPRLPPPVDQKLVDEFQQWNVDYDQWLAGAGTN